MRGICFDAAQNREELQVLFIFPACLNVNLTDSEFRKFIFVDELFEVPTMYSCGFTPRMVGARITCEENLLACEVLVDRLTWIVPKRNVRKRVLDWFLDLKSNRSLTKNKLQANSIVVYNSYGEIVLIDIFDNSLFAIGEGTTFTVEIPKPLYEIEWIKQ